jgi:hypothetical protein
MEAAIAVRAASSCREPEESLNDRAAGTIFRVERVPPP